MCHLVTDHSLEVQKNAYNILQMAARKRTEHLVIEAGVDTESNVKATLPLELLDIIQRHVNFTNIDDEDEEQVSASNTKERIARLKKFKNIFGSLLGWMLMFDLFQNAVRNTPSRKGFELTLNYSTVIQSQVRIYRANAELGPCCR